MDHGLASHGQRGRRDVTEYVILPSTSICSIQANSTELTILVKSTIVNLLKIFQHVMRIFYVSLPCAQEPSSDPYNEPDQVIVAKSGSYCRNLS
jgi:hypothetical protein